MYDYDFIPIKENIPENTVEKDPVTSVLIASERMTVGIERMVCASVSISGILVIVVGSNMSIIFKVNPCCLFNICKLLVIIVTDLVLQAT